MTDEILIRFIRDEMSPTEEKQVLDWINETPEHADYFIKLKNIFVFQNMPDEPISWEDLNSITDITNNAPGFTFAPSKYIPYIIAACFAILFFLHLFGVFNVKDSNHHPAPSIDVHLAAQLHTLYTEQGVKAKTVLPDGSNVTLNSATKIIYPDHFDGATREVFLSGEAYFEIVTDSLKPMIVNTNYGFCVEVLGTTFNIRSYDDDTDAQVTLYSGKIHVKKRDPLLNMADIVEMSPSQSIVLGKTIKHVLVKTTHIESQSAWKDGYLVFESLPFREVIKRLERWHGIKIKTENTKIFDLPVSANFQSESVVQIMELLKFSIKIDYDIFENEVVIK